LRVEDTLRESGLIIALDESQSYFSTAPFVGAALSFLLLAETPGKTEFDEPGLNA